MTNHKKDEKVQDLDEELIQELVSSLESAINSVLAEHPEVDPRLELLTTLMSFVSQVAHDLEMEEESFVGLALDFYQDQEETPKEFETEVKPKTKSKKKKAKPN